MRCSRRSDKSQALIMEGNSGTACTHKGCTHHTQSCSYPLKRNTHSSSHYFSLIPFRPFFFSWSASLTLPSFGPASLVTRLFLQVPSFPSLPHRPGFDPVLFSALQWWVEFPSVWLPCPVTDGHQATETKSL